MSEPELPHEPRSASGRDARAGAVVVTERRGYGSYRSSAVVASFLVVLVSVVGLSRVIPEGEPIRSYASAASGTCPVTVPEGDFVPPGGYPATPPARHDTSWHGTNGLWTKLPREAQAQRLEPTPDEVLLYRFLLWSVHQGSPEEEPFPEVIVTAERLDADAPVATAHRANNGWTEDLGLLMIHGMSLPAPGCWEITTAYRDATLTWIIEVEAS